MNHTVVTFVAAVADFASVRRIASRLLVLFVAEGRDASLNRLASTAFYTQGSRLDSTPGREDVQSTSSGHVFRSSFTVPELLSIRRE